jgi:hypothetical protein
MEKELFHFCCKITFSHIGTSCKGHFIGILATAIMLVSKLTLPLSLLSITLVSSFLSSSYFLTRQRFDASTVNLFGRENADVSPFQNGNNNQRRRLEFKNLEPLPENDVRRKRIQRDLETKANFAQFGDSLWDLRAEMESLSDQMANAIERGDEQTEEITREKLLYAEGRDPELVYRIAVGELEQAEREGRIEDAKRHRARAMAARSCLPQFNLDGLWVGKYGSSYNLLNISYVGDTMIATKLVGDRNVPQGAVSFRVDLHPLRLQQKTPLEPIILTKKAAAKWGTRKLPRYPGEGQVAEDGFRNNQWLDGQLIIIGDEYFSFAWIPIEQQIFFGRPSPELALKMLRDNGVSRIYSEFPAPPTLEDDVQIQKDFVMRCLEITHDHEDEYEGNNAFGGIWNWNNEMEECYFE